MCWDDGAEYMKTIPLTRGQEAIVDDSDFEWLNQWIWKALVSSCGHGYYAVRRCRAAETRTTGAQCVLMHRQILGLVHGDVRQADHINGDRLDNRRVNLRIATPAQNQANTGLPAHNSSGFKGVSIARSSRWKAQLSVNNRNVVIGTFDTPEEAYAAYCSAIIKYRGEFARLG